MTRQEAMLRTLIKDTGVGKKEELVSMQDRVLWRD